MRDGHPPPRPDDGDGAWSGTIGDGTLSLDAMTKHYIHEFLSYRFAATLDSASAFRLERQIKAGALDAGKPILNPL